MLYATPPDYDVFKRPPEEPTEPNESASADGTDEADTPGPVMARANWTGAVPADD